MVSLTTEPSSDIIDKSQSTLAYDSRKDQSNHEKRFNLSSIYEPLLDQGYIPDILLRMGIRQLLSRRLKQLDQQAILTSTQNDLRSPIRSIDSNNQDIRSRSFSSCSLVSKYNDYKVNYVNSLRSDYEERIAIHTQEANEQHYEIPTEFFQLCLGERMKYSSCLFETGAKTLEDAEDAMLSLYMERAQVEDGMHILDLGCGWGSLCLYVCEKFPNAQVTALSNSNSQREFILNRAKEKGFRNLTVYTGDINTFQFPENMNEEQSSRQKKKQFDRIISIEMFEHMKNYESLFKKVSEWLVPETGRLFVHVFAHKHLPYDFKTDEDHSWMAKYFFTGGTMPSEDLFLWFQNDLQVIHRWTVNGQNYGETSEQWLKRLDQNKKQAMNILMNAYDQNSELSTAWFNRWRVFYLAVAELFNYNRGEEWVVVHYLFKRR